MLRAFNSFTAFRSMASMSSIECRPGQLSFIPFGRGLSFFVVLRRGIFL